MGILDNNLPHQSKNSDLSFDYLDGLQATAGVQGSLVNPLGFTSSLKVLDVTSAPDLLPNNISPQVSHTNEQAVILETTDGKFFCSELGCDATYLRAGDCRRHLKKHNGPFFPCPQRNCDMKFYRHDKLRAHMKQGHGTPVAPPRRGRRGAISEMMGSG